jgi:hypothetical protein
MCHRMLLASLHCSCHGMLPTSRNVGQSRPAERRTLEAAQRAPRSSSVPRRASGSPSPCAAAATCRRWREAEHAPSDAGRRRWRPASQHHGQCGMLRSSSAPRPHLGASRACAATWHGIKPPWQLIPEAASAHFMLMKRSARLGRSACAWTAMHGRHTVFDGPTTCMDAAQQPQASTAMQAKKTWPQ